MGDNEARFRHSQVAVAGSSLHVVELGDLEAVPLLFLHGWPGSWRSWSQVMRLASRQVRAIAIDLPGIGESTGNPIDGSKRQLATAVHTLVESMGRGISRWWAKMSAAWSLTPICNSSRTSSKR
jgi:pimeloyl-ACP methyl ester carboxylesterase